MDGVAGPQFWSYLLKAAAHDQRDPNGYSYALATQGPRTSPCRSGTTASGS